MGLKLLPLLAAAFILTACSDPPDTEAGPSPLASVDMDRARLYLLLRAGGGVKPICGDYFEVPTSAQTVDYGTECQAWQLAMLDHLRLNGIGDLQAEHLEDRTFWLWWTEAQSTIARCRDAVREQDRIRREAKSPGWRLPDLVAHQNCDPYDRAIQTEGKSLEDLGIRRARVSTTDETMEQ